MDYIPNQRRMKMKEYRVKVTVRNNLLLSAIEEAGYKTQAEFARSADIKESQVTALVGLRTCPITDDGSFTQLAKTIMEVLGACPTDLWTNEQLSMRLKHNTAQGAISKTELLPALGMNPIDLLEFAFPDDLVEKQQNKQVIESVLDTLTPRESKIIKLRFGIGNVENEGETLETIGKMFDLTREGIRAIEAKALKKLRHSSRSYTLRKLT
jgi:RNA polymerase sigma factor (sigma-70 family)